MQYDFPDSPLSLYTEAYIVLTPVHGSTGPVLSEVEGLTTNGIGIWEVETQPFALSLAKGRTSYDTLQRARRNKEKATEDGI